MVAMVVAAAEIQVAIPVVESGEEGRLVEALAAKRVAVAMAVLTGKVEAVAEEVNTPQAVPAGEGQQVGAITEVWKEAVTPVRENLAVVVVVEEVKVTQGVVEAAATEE